jgi:hypothetical protein
MFFKHVSLCGIDVGHMNWRTIFDIWCDNKNLLNSTLELEVNFVFFKLV